MATVFDAATYKNTTREQWQSAASAWNAWTPVLRSWLGPATDLMLDMAHVGAGAEVLDVAAGAGDQSLHAAARVGPKGRVLATDIAPNLLAYCAANAQAAGLANVETMVADGEDLPVPAGSFDAVISRVGLIYFPDQIKALKAMRSALRPGGWIGAIVYATADENRFFSIPVSIIRRRASLPPPQPGQPGPFSLGQSGAIEAAFERAGFRNVSAVKLVANLSMTSASECVRFERESFGALHQMLSGLDDRGKAEAWAEIEESLRSFEGPDGFAGPCTLIVAAGEK
ncbi:MAG: class I SAM-dependent methyltransferase [Dongiaceae bacterium]